MVKDGRSQNIFMRALLQPTSLPNTLFSLAACIFSSSTVWHPFSLSGFSLD